MTLTAFDAAAQAAPAGCAELEVRQVRPRQGFLMLAAYGDAESFDKKALVSMRVAAGEAVLPGTFGPSWSTARVPLDGKAIVVKLSS
jgi:5-deoxy-D-glucuronate isomerase